MTKKMWSLLLTGALIAGVFTAVPAQAGPEIPETANIEDPSGDANGHSFATGASGGPSLRAADILKVWFTHDAENLYTHVLTDGASQLDSIQYQIYVDPGVGDDCLQLRGFTAGANNDAYSRVFASGDCGDLDERFEGGIVTEENEETQGLHTITIPRSSSDYFADGAVLAAPLAYTRPNVEGVASAGIIDNTDAGTDYTISSGGAPTGPPVAEEPPGKNDPPGQGNQNCSKIKNKKKKKACKKNNGKGPDESAGCAAYVPGEQGAEAETLTVTDAATEEAPLELEVETAEGLGVGRGSLGPLVSHAYVNLQVESSTPTAGLWVKVSFAPYQDYDLYLDPADGSGEVAAAGGFGPEQDAEPGDSQSDIGSETLTGIRTDDCGGWTLDIAGATTEGGTVTLTTWLGAELWDPESQAPVGAKAFVF